MGYTVSCTDMGVHWCDQILYGDTEEGLLQACISHGAMHAGVSEEQLVTPEFLAYLKNSIRESNQSATT